MPACLYTATITGLDCTKVSVEAAVFRGLAEFSIVGLGGSAIQEAKKRVYSAIKSSGLVYPPTRKIVNLGPADIRKQGTHFDVPIALGLLADSGQVATKFFADSLFIGELALTGRLKRINGVLLMAMFARGNGFKRIFVPKANCEELTMLKDIEIVPVTDLHELVTILNKSGPLPTFKPKLSSSLAARSLPLVDLAEIQGQILGKRAVTIAAAGRHNLLMSGPPGIGKTMLAQALTGLLPAPSEAEYLTLARIYSRAGMPTPDRQRPFRQLSRDATAGRLIGSSTKLLPGELSLAHSGVLFIDELLELPRAILELLREPLEQRQVRLGGTSYPAAPIVVGAFNPCPCGYFGSADHTCDCSPHRVNQYQARLSPPLRDRFELKVKLARVDTASPTQESSTAKTRATIEQALRSQQERLKSLGKSYNSELAPQELAQFAQLTNPALEMAKQAVERKRLSLRAYHQLQRVARTIADLAGSSVVREEHVLEATCLTT